MREVKFIYGCHIVEYRLDGHIVVRHDKCHLSSSLFKGNGLILCEEYGIDHIQRSDAIAVIRCNSKVYRLTCFG